VISIALRATAIQFVDLFVLVVAKKFVVLVSNVDIIMNVKKVNATIINIFNLVVVVMVVVKHQVNHLQQHLQKVNQLHLLM
jgi:hypothetical protein